VCLPCVGIRCSSVVIVSCLLGVAFLTVTKYVPGDYVIDMLLHADFQCIALFIGCGICGWGVKHSKITSHNLLKVAK
jgi:hypothetical protein